MKRRLVSFVFILSSICAFAKEIPQPPIAKKVPHEMTIHGDTRADPYFWLRGRNNPAVKAYLEAENVYADAIMAYTKPFQDELYQEILSHIKETDLSVPYREGEYIYYTRTQQGKQYSIFCRKKEISMLRKRFCWIGMSWVRAFLILARGH
jgi:protease II